MAKGGSRPNATRWRLTWWLIGETIPVQARWYNSTCKLCAAKRALSLAEAYAKVKLAPIDAVRWQVGRIGLHIDEPTIVASSISMRRELVKRHAHREPGTGAVRTTVRARGIVGKSGSEGVP